MADHNLKGSISTEEQLLNGHKIIYLFNVHRLELIERTFYPLEYHTRCPIIDTSWEIRLKYERLQLDDYVSYTFTVKLTRTDSLSHRVKASIYVQFYDTHGSPMYYPLTFNKERIVPNDEMQKSLEDILPEVLNAVASVEVVVTIENCHTGSDFHRCAAYVGTDKNSLNLSKL